ncbi:Hypothetical predicted protein [Podarcis lilfordi]|uniref:Uncharacterized protein n=1 Tax=Podarcis lilfordi TaxID=74358 RepID=A0AA35KR94_9SAUR|nr:Hypothetical predicted protein [Podarcis lilfordi]
MPRVQGRAPLQLPPPPPCDSRQLRSRCGRRWVSGVAADKEAAGPLLASLPRPYPGLKASSLASRKLACQGSEGAAAAVAASAPMEVAAGGGIPCIIHFGVEALAPGPAGVSRPTTI